MKLDPNFFWTSRDDSQSVYGTARTKTYTSIKKNLADLDRMPISNWTSPETFCTITGMVTPDIYIATLNNSYGQTGIEPLVYNTDRQYGGTDRTTLTVRLAETEEYKEGIITLTITNINAEYLTEEINQKINKTPW